MSMDIKSVIIGFGSCAFLAVILNYLGILNAAIDFRKKLLEIKKQKLEIKKLQKEAERENSPIIKPEEDDLKKYDPKRKALEEAVNPSPLLPSVTLLDILAALAVIGIICAVAIPSLLR